MVISTLIETIIKELKNMWASETTLPENVPGGFGGRTIPKNQVSFVAFIILTILLAAIFWNAAANTDTVPLPSGGGDGNTELVGGALNAITDHSNENTEQPIEVSVEEKAIAEITFTLSWEDEQPGMGRTNDPDEFAIEVTTPWGETNETPMTQNNGNNRQGEIELEFTTQGEYPDTGSAGSYDVIVKMGDAGDIRLGPVVVSSDDGNDWTLTVTYTYWKEASGPIQE